MSTDTNSSIEDCWLRLAPDATLVVDESGRIAGANALAERLFGYPPGALAGQPLETLIPARSRDSHGRHVADHFRDPRHRPMDAGPVLWGLRRDGSEFAAQISLSPLPAPTGHRVLAAVRDVSEYRRIQRALERTTAELAQQVAARDAELAQATAELRQQIADRDRAEARYHQLVESQPDLICRFLPDTTLTFANAAYGRFFGRRPAELLDRRFIEFLAPEERAAVRAQLAAFSPASPARQHEREAVRADGEVRWHLWHDFAFFDDRGHATGFQSVGVDITERKRAEDSLRASHALLDAIGHVQSLYIAGADPRAVFDGMLSALLAITESEYGFIGEVPREADGTPYLKTQAITNIAWDEATRAFYAANAPEGMEFRNLQTLFGAVMTSAQPVLSNDPAKDPRGRGIPPGHPPLNAFMGLPFFRGEELVGMAGVANRPGGYGAEMVARLRPFLSTCASVTQAIRENQRRRRAEEALRESEARLRAAIESIPFDFFLIGDAGRYVLQNSISRKLWGDAVGKRPEDVTDDAAMLAHWNSNHRRAFAGEVVAEETRFTVGNEERYIHSIIAPIEDRDEIRGIVGLNIDVTDRRRAEEDLLESEARFRLFMQHFPGLAYIKDSHARTLFANRGFETYLDLAPSEMVGKTNAELFPAEFAARITADDRRILESGQYEEREERYGGRDWSTLKFALHRPGRTPLLGGFTLDITERKRAEERLRALNRALRMRGACNRALVHATDEATLPDEICRLVVEVGGYRLAWVGLAERDDAKTVRPVGRAGHEAGYVESARITWADDERGRGPTGTAIRTGQPVVARIASDDPGFAPWRAQALERGYASSIALPLRQQARPIGALNIYAAEPEAFDAEEIALLTELADDLAYGLSALRAHAERRRMDAALRESEERFRQLAEAAFEGIAVSRGGRLLDASPQLAEMLGCSAEELVGREIADFVPPEARDLVRERLRSGRLEPVEHALQRKDGSRFPVEVRVRTALLRGEAVRISAIRDITERKRVEEALRQSEERLTHALDAARAGAWEWNVATGRAIWSDGNYRVLGLAPGSVEARYENWLRCVHPDDRAEAQRQVVEAMERGSDLDIEFRVVWPDGSVRWLNDIGKMRYGSAGQPVGMYGIQIDVTDRKRAEAELARHREHLEELVAERTAELRQAMSQLVQAEKLAALGNLVAGMAHELNTPLGNARVIAGSLGEALREFEAGIEAGGLRRSQLDAFLARGREAVGILERNAARAADLIAHFKQVAVDQTSARRRRFDLRQTVEELLVTLQPQFKRTAHRVELDIPAELELDSYPGPLEQVIANLVSNSLVHGFAGMEAGRIRLRAQAIDPAQVSLRYADNGAGIPKKILNRIFEPFFTTKFGQGGSGLGLHIVYNLVTGVLGGTIRADSVPGHGVTFALDLPRIAPDRPGLETPSSIDE